MAEAIIIAGSVGSGKTTWVQERKTWGDLVLDTDMIWTALMGGEHYPQPVQLLPHGSLVRSRRISADSISARSMFGRRMRRNRKSWAGG